MFGGYRLGGMPAPRRSPPRRWCWGPSCWRWRLMVGPPATRAVVMTVALALSASVWALRPHVLSLLLLVVLLGLLMRERFRVIPLLFLLWANAHGGVVLGGLALAVACAMAWLRWWRRRDAADARRARVLSVVVALSGLACAATPLGFGIYRFVIESTARSTAVGITEWFPTLPTDVFGVLFWAATLALVALVVHRRRELASGQCSSWADWVAVATAGALLPLAIRSGRNTAPFLLVAMAGRQPTARRRLPFPRRAGARFRRQPAPARQPRSSHASTSRCWRRFRSRRRWRSRSCSGRAPRCLGWRPISDGALTAARACDGPLYNPTVTAAR